MEGTNNKSDLQHGNGGKRKNHNAPHAAAVASHAKPNGTTDDQHCEQCVHHGRQANTQNMG